ncbi:uncharacterized protein [Rhodnius prolixus]|uniref:uncharacterized protein n=1 Tax=Rhodnius prolixus TaxID=13249 RepID=UPI003D18E9F4
MSIKKLFFSTIFIQIVVPTNLLAFFLMNLLGQGATNEFTVSNKPYPNLIPIKLRFKRHKLNKNDQSSGSVNLNEILGQLLNKSDTFTVPKAQTVQPLYNGSNLIERILNDSKIKANLFINDILWQTPRPVMRTDFNTLPTHRMFNYYSMQQQQPRQQQVNQQPPKRPESKDNIVEVYKKLASDFQTLQQLLAENKVKESTKLPEFDQFCGVNKPTQPTTPSTVMTKNMIMIENIRGDDGCNYTRITLLKRKLCEKKKDIDLPSFPFDKGGSSNIKLQINDQDENEIIPKGNIMALKIYK